MTASRRIRPSYRYGLRWIANNCDTTFLDDVDADGRVIPSIETALLADLFGFDTERVCRDLLKVASEIDR